ncbi:hypothetical protein EUX98_g7955 [Antrodiella citrinella]|uniref:DUF7702 domain-containing protein n=1 Tax=Antrodiella citrinella TaxID=2447956 RepID=A0A4S4MD41_9APHY|nr:hypothetical protein EUX98_g7955 [Antrodiella citrinella]
MVSVALSTFGGVKAGTAKNQDDLNSGENLRHIGGILYLVLYACLVLIHVWFWTQKRRILKYRRMLLAGISCALPFLFIRVMYSVLSGFSPAGIPGGPPPAQNDLSKFNSATGSWALYLLMAVVTEIIVVSIYLFVGIMFPVYKDYAIGKLDTGYESDVELSRGGADGKPFL